MNSGTDKPRMGDLTQGPVAPHLVRLTVPMLLGMSSMMIAGMFDIVFVGWIGTLELAAVSLTMPAVMVVMSLAMGVGIGASSIVARTIGGGDMASVQRLSTHSLLLVLAISLACTVLGIAFAEPIFRGLGAKDELLALVVPYIRIWFLGLPLFAVPMVGTSIMRSVGHAKVPGIIMTASAALQILMAPVLIFGIPGVWEGLGYLGSAWAFVVSRAITFFYTWWVLDRDMQLLTREGLDVKTIRGTWREVMKIGVPASLSNLIGPVTMVVIFALLASHGAAVIAAFGVASRIESLATMILMSLTSSLSPFIGQNWGAKRDRRVREAMRLCDIFSLAWGVFIFALLAGFGRTIVGWINHDPAVITATYWYLVLVPLSYGFMGLAMVSGSCFMALGKPMPTLVMSIARMSVVYIPVAYLGSVLWGYQGIFAATAVTNFVMGVVAYLWVRAMLRDQMSRRKPARAENPDDPARTSSTTLAD